MHIRRFNNAESIRPRRRTATMSRNDDDGHLGHCLGFDVLVGVPLVGEGRVVGLDDVIQLLGLLALQRAVAVSQPKILKHIPTIYLSSAILFRCLQDGKSFLFRFLR